VSKGESRLLHLKDVNKNTEEETRRKTDRMGEKKKEKIRKRLTVIY